MKKLLAAAAAVSLLAIAAPASAGVYGSLGYSQLDFDDVIADVKFDRISGRIGWAGESWLGAEAELSLGTGKEDSGGVDYKNESELAAFVTVHYDVAEQVRLIGRAGYASIRLEATPGTDGSADGAAVGVGVEFLVTERDGFRADYTYYDYTQDLGEELYTWTVSYVRRFN